MDDFPGNSHAAKAKIQSQDRPESEKSETAASDTKTPTKKTANKVVSGKARKKPLGQRFKEMFVSNGSSFAEYLVEQVVVPMVKDMVLSVITQTADGFRQGVEEKLFGSDTRSTRTRTTSYGTGRPHVNYTRYSSNSAVSRSHPPGQAPRIIRRSNVIEDIIIPSREDGDAIKEELQAVIDSVGHCTVGDLYSTVDISPNKTDEAWGWDDIRSARTRALPTGEFLLVMPRPIPIEN